MNAPAKIETKTPAKSHAIRPRANGRPWTFYLLSALFALYLIARQTQYRYYHYF